MTSWPCSRVCRDVRHNWHVAEGQVYTRHPPLAPEAARVIRSARQRLGWSIAYAADVIGMSEIHLWRLENSQRAISDTMAEKVIAGLGMRGRAVAVLREQAVAGWATRHGKPLQRATGRGNRRRTPPKPRVSHRGSCLEQVERELFAWAVTSRRA
jgi:hypothetical protein